MGFLLTECNANYRTAWQASEQEKSYLINIRRQQQLQDDKREAVVVTMKCGGCVPMSYGRLRGASRK
jgi:formate dehydrogenase assembly factor FdhD